MGITVIQLTPMEYSLYREQKTNTPHKANKHVKGFIKMEELQDFLMSQTEFLPIMLISVTRRNTTVKFVRKYRMRKCSTNDNH